MTKLTDTKRIDADLRSRYESAYADAKEHGWEHWIDDAVPVLPALKKFYMEFCHTRKDAGFYIDTRPIRTYVGEDAVPVYNQISISFVEAPEMVVGGLKVERDGASGETVYTVISPLIKNQRFREHNPKYNRKSTKNFANAIKTAKQYIKAFSFEQVRNNAQGTVNDAQGYIRTAASDTLYQTARAPFEDILSEAKAMMAAGYKPATGPFVKLIELLETRGEELNRARNYAPGLKAFVWLLNDRAVYQYDGGELMSAATPADMPQELIDKVSVLQIGNSGQAIIDVGVKVDDTKYWVFL